MTRGTNDRQPVTNHVIPEAAVEAAVDAMVASKLGDHAGINGEELVEAARAALEAAAPHIRAAALEAVADELDGADRVTRERDGYTATINLPNAAIYLRRHAATYRPTP